MLTKYKLTVVEVKKKSGHGEEKVPDDLDSGLV